MCSSSRQSERLEVPATWQKQDRDYPVVTCADCGHRYLSERVPADAAHLLYAEYVDTYSSGDWGQRTIIRLTARVRAAWIRKTIRQPARALDIGSGFPFLSINLSRRWRDCELHSLDLLSPGQVTQIENQEQSIVHHNCYIDDWTDDERPFDLITSFHTIEHAYDPSDFLRRVRQRLAPGGTFILGLPVFDHPGIRLFGVKSTAYHVPYHLHFFTGDGIVALIEKEGFSVTGTHREKLFGSVNSTASTLSLLGVRELSRPSAIKPILFAPLWPLYILTQFFVDLGGCLVIRATH